MASDSARPGPLSAALPADPAGTEAPIRAFWRRAVLFVAIGLLIYGAFLAIAEYRVRQTGERNPLFRIATVTAPPDVVILGASHAMPLGFEEIGPALEAAAGRPVMTLAIEGGGVVPNAFLFSALLRKAAPREVIYVLDSFVFLSPQWNEERLADSGLFARAPYDAAIFGAIMAEPAAWPVLAGYLTGFDKVNGMLHLDIDRSEAELTRFDRVYRANDQIDSQRIAYLFPAGGDDLVATYVAGIERMIVDAQASGIRFRILLMPAPPRYSERLPASHTRVMSALTEMLERHRIEVIDHSGLLQDDENYYDTDHLNRQGALSYATDMLGPLLADTGPPGSSGD